MPAETTGILVALKSHGVYITGALAAAVGYGDLRRKVSQNMLEINELKDHEEKLREDLTKIHQDINKLPMEIITTMKGLDLLK